ncbi:hypothetical protein [Acidiphilium iwatense]|uniref:hypothetical protein n=1 Tax=Acidiphilium iwatense TaxID=768198 RepID=UPI001F3780E5|nr:hypothetical protein [Acidiphilium iwatense]
MTIILIIMISAVTLSAFASPIGPTALGTPPLRMAPTIGPRPTSSGLPPAPPSPVGSGPSPRGSLLNLSV